MYAKYRKQKSDTKIGLNLKRLSINDNRYDYVIRKHWINQQCFFLMIHKIIEHLVIRVFLQFIAS